MDAELEKLQESYATLVPVEGREVAEEGDFAVIDHVGHRRRQALRGRHRRGRHRQGRAQGEIGAGFIPALVGKKIGDTVEIDEAAARPSTATRRCAARPPT